jgi:hypothetical protein
MAAAIQLAPEGTKIVRLAVRTLGGTEAHIAVEQLPTSAYRMPLATLINQWTAFGHMSHKTYAMVEQLLEDAFPGYQSWQEVTEKRTLSNAEETAIIRTALSAAGIRPKSIRHHFGPVIIIMGRSEAHEGEFLQIEMLAWEALESVHDARNCCAGIHVVETWRGKLAAGYERFRRYKR